MLLDQLDYLAERNPQAAASASITIDRAVARLAKHPNMGRPGRVPSTRGLVIPNTNFVAIYRISTQSIDILRLLHAAQRWPDTHSDDPPP